MGIAKGQKLERKLTVRQLKFIEFYNGNATDAARKAGYQGSDQVLGKTGFDLLRHPKVARAIKDREQLDVRKKVATRQDRQAFWTEIMLNEDEPIFVRLKASELLAKSEGDFLLKIEHSGKVTLEELVVGSLEKADG